MQNSSVSWIAQVVFHLDIVWDLNVELFARTVNLGDGFLDGHDLLSGVSTSTLDNPINVHVATLPVLARGPILAEHLGREAPVRENVIEDVACSGGRHVEFTWRHEVANDTAVLEGQFVVFAMFGGGRSA